MNNIKNHAIENHLKQRIANHEIWFGDFTQSQKFPYAAGVGQGTISSREITPLNEFTKLPVPENGIDPTYIVALPHVLGLDTHLAYQKIRFISLAFATQSFYQDQKPHLELLSQRMIVLFGMNRRKSLDPSRNQQFKDACTKIKLCTRTPIRIYARQWKPIWTKTAESVARKDHKHIYSAKKAFLLVKAFYPGLVNNLLEKIETNHNFSDQIPYQKIRQWIKDHPETTKILNTLKEKTNPLYWVTMDDDFVSLRKDKGVFAIYDQLAKRDPSPQLMTTGYWAPDKAHPIIKLGIELDMKVREAMSKHLPASPYFPEPCFALLISDLNTFKRIKYTANKNLESRRLIQTAQTAGAIDDSRVIFLAQPALITTIPEWMITKKISDITITKVQDFYKKQSLETLHGGIAQTHLDTLSWAEQIYLSLPITVSAVSDIKPPLTKIVRIFDPILLAKDLSWGSRYSHSHFKMMLDAYENYQAIAIKVLTTDNPVNILAEQFCQLDQLKTLSREEKINLKAGLETYFTQSRTAKVTIKNLGVTDVWMTKIILAAKDSGHAIWKVMSSAENCLKAN